MEVKIYKASIIIIASSHNPSILSPQWFSDNKLHDKKPEKFVNTYDFSFLDFEDLSVVVDKNRFTISAKLLNTQTLKKLSEISSQYIKLLQHNPYKALGLNFGWKVNSDNIRIDLNINGNTKKDVSRFLEEDKIKFGGMIYAKKESFDLSIRIEPRENTILNNFNYHHNIENLYIEKIISLIENYESLFNYSKHFLEKLYKRG